MGLAAWRGLSCRDAGRVDLRADAEGRLQILEINPLAGLHPSHSDLPILWTQVGRRVQGSDRRDRRVGHAAAAAPRSAGSAPAQRGGGRCPRGGAGRAGPGRRGRARHSKPAAIACAPSRWTSTSPNSRARSPASVPSVCSTWWRASTATIAASCSCRCCSSAWGSRSPARRCRRS